MVAMDYLDALRRENEAFYAAVDPARFAERVGSCPAWSLGDLVWHMGEVHWFWGSIVEGRLKDPLDVSEPQRPADGRELVSWARESGERIRGILSEADPATEVWTWSDQNDVAFIRRRMAHETAVHRWDAQSTTSDGGRPVDAALAADGIQEFLSYFFPYSVGANEPYEGTVHLHCTDVEGEWLLMPDGTHTTGHSKGDAALRGTASDLLLTLWRRAPLDQVDIVGDRSVASELIDRLRID